MSKIFNKNRKHNLFILAIVVMSWIITPGAYAEQTSLEERPTGSAMTFDALIVRPALAVGTVLGTSVFVLSLPFSLLGGNTPEVGKKLVVDPFKATFFRCLGCTQKHMGQRE